MNIEKMRLHSMTQITYGYLDNLYASYCLALNVEREFNLPLTKLAEKITEFYKIYFTKKSVL